jgi:hypothetical protein
MLITGVSKTEILFDPGIIKCISKIHSKNIS